MKQLFFSISLLSLLMFNLSSCKKVVKIPDPINTVTTDKAFGSDANANSAIIAIYSNLSWAGNTLSFANGGACVYGGLSADELLAFNNGGDLGQFETNTLQSTNSITGGIFWTPAYFDIYMANAAVEALEVSSGVGTSLKSQLTGEAKFIRAYCYFYLTNLYGDVPLTLTSDWHKTALMARTPQSAVYNQVIQDLKDAESLLIPDYSMSNSEKIRVNKWAASAMLARVYLYTGDYVNAEAEASNVINSNMYVLEPDVLNVFLKNNNEAIFQLQTINTDTYATYEGQNFIPPDNMSSPNYFLTPFLLNSFEAGDKRRAGWVDSTDYSGTTYYYPAKYKVRMDGSGNVTEYCTLLRLAEQYLIRAESRALLNTNLSGATDDINSIRARAGLPNLPANLTQTQVLAAVAQERRIEFFAEHGHRWLDLKRTNQATTVLGAIPTKQPWSPNQLLYPIPISELQKDHNLTQNSGY